MTFAPFGMTALNEQISHRVALPIHEESFNKLLLLFLETKFLKIIFRRLGLIPV